MSYDGTQAADDVDAVRRLCIIDACIKVPFSFILLCCCGVQIWWFRHWLWYRWRYGASTPLLARFRCDCEFDCHTTNVHSVTDAYGGRTPNVTAAGTRSSNNQTRTNTGAAAAALGFGVRDDRDAQSGTSVCCCRRYPVGPELAAAPNAVDIPPPPPALTPAADIKLNVYLPLSVLQSLLLLVYSFDPDSGIGFYSVYTAATINAFSLIVMVSTVIVWTNKEVRTLSSAGSSVAAGVATAVASPPAASTDGGGGGDSDDTNLSSYFASFPFGTAVHIVCCTFSLIATSTYRYAASGSGRAAGAYVWYSSLLSFLLIIGVHIIRCLMHWITHRRTTLRRYIEMDQLRYTRSVQSDAHNLQLAAAAVAASPATDHRTLTIPETSGGAVIASVDSTSATAAAAAAALTSPTAVAAVLASWEMSAELKRLYSVWLRLGVYLWVILIGLILIAYQWLVLMFAADAQSPLAPATEFSIANAVYQSLVHLFCAVVIYENWLPKPFWSPPDSTPMAQPTPPPPPAAANALPVFVPPPPQPEMQASALITGTLATDAPFPPAPTAAAGGGGGGMILIGAAAARIAAPQSSLNLAHPFIAAPAPSQFGFASGVAPQPSLVAPPPPPGVDASVMMAPRPGQAAPPPPAIELSALASPPPATVPVPATTAAAPAASVIHPFSAQSDESLLSSGGGGAGGTGSGGGSSSMFVLLKSKQ